MVRYIEASKLTIKTNCIKRFKRFREYVLDLNNTPKKLGVTKAKIPLLKIKLVKITAILTRGDLWMRHTSP